MPNPCCSGWRYVGLLVSVISVAAYGCGSSGPATGKIAGTIAFHGKPVSGGIINFAMPKEGNHGSAPLGADGSFTLPEPLPVGTYTVYLTTPPGTPATDEKPFTPPPPPPDVPKRYLSAASSDLKATVNAGDNNLKLEFHP